MARLKTYEFSLAQHGYFLYCAVASEGTCVNEGTSAFRDLAENAALAVGAIYTIGLLIVNIDLARYGIMNLTLARPEYVLAGALWIFLMAAVFAVQHFLDFPTGGFVNLARGIFGWKYLGRFLRVLVYVATLFFCLQLPLMTISGGETSPYSWQSLLATAVILVNFEAVIGVLEEIRPLVGEESLLAKLVLPRRYGFHPPDLATSLFVLILALSLYSTYAFPHFAAQFGGGIKPVAEVYLKRKPDIPWTSLGIAVSVDGRRLGPVQVILETEHGIAISGLKLTESGFFSSKARAAWLDTSEVTAIFYGEPQLPASKSGRKELNLPSMMHPSAIPRATLSPGPSANSRIATPAPP